jgi:hypothetical protein
MAFQQPHVPPPSPPKPKTKKWPWVVGVSVVAIIGAAAATGGSGKGQNTPAAQVLSQISANSTTAPATRAAVPSTTASTTFSTTTKPPPPPPEVFQGKGDNVVNLKRGTEPGIVTFECPKCTSNVIVESDGRESLLVNTIGAYTGRKLINVADGSMTTSISIQAKGAWKLTVSGLDTIERVIGKPATGKGDSVVMMAGDFSSATIANKGKSNFIVTYVDVTAGRTGLAVNEIGSYQGTVRLPGPAIIQVESSGTWTITPN